jgi:GNAT superfamily N-acetyltransferase
MPELRPARPADIPRLIEIRAAVRENRLERLVIGTEEYRPYVGDGRCWVAEQDGTIQGFAALDAEAASVWALFVGPEAEGNGLGRALLDRLILEARQRGLPTLTLETAAGTRAEHVYLQAGWQLISRDPNDTLHLRLSL